ncbi:MAG: YdbH domain-containing protein [Woeseiaceae bacterium]|nr:YdbH domain-containing protein [Woeseiaceae bacterium]
MHVALKRTGIGLLIVLLIAALALVIANHRRDEIGKTIVARALADTGYEVTALSVADISPSKLELNRLELRSANGSVYRVRNLIFPVRFEDILAGPISAEELDIELAEDSDAAGPLAPMLATVVDTVPRLGTLRIDNLSVSGLPPLNRVELRRIDASQELSFRLAGLELSIKLAARDGDSIQTRMSATSPDGSAALSVNGSLAVGADSPGLTGTMTLDLALAEPLLKEIGMMPARITDASGQLEGELQVQIDRPSAGQVQIDWDAMPGTTLDVVYAGDIAEWPVELTTNHPLSVQALLGTAEWRVINPDLKIATHYDPLGVLDLIVSDLDCRNGIECQFDVRSELEQLTFGDTSIEVLGLSLPTSLQVEDGLRAEFGAEGVIEASNVASRGQRVGTLRFLELDGAHWLLDEATSRLQIDNTRVELRDLRSDSLELALRQGLTADAALLLDDGLLQSSGTLTDDCGALTSEFEFAYGVESGDYRLDVPDLGVDFGLCPLTDLIGGLPAAFDLVAGQLTLSGGINGQNSPATQFAMTLDNAAGRFGNSAFTGVSTTANLGDAGDSGYRLTDARLSADLLDAGIEVRNIEADGTVGLSPLQVDVDSLSMQALGGVIDARPFSFSPETKENEIVLDVDSVQLGLIVELAEFEAVEAEGAVSGTVPVLVGPDSIRVLNGTLSNDDPGGTIRYRAGGAGSGDPDSRFAFVTRMLEYFEFDSLVSDVSYDENGVLQLQMTLRGINPEQDPLQPIVLNLSVENNIPELLRSLQAVRSIEDILEQATRD